MLVKRHPKLDLEAACALDRSGRGVATLEAAFEMLARSIERDNPNEDGEESAATLGVEAWLRQWNAPRDS